MQILLLGDPQLSEHLLSRLGHERVYHNGHLPDGFEKGVHNRIQLAVFSLLGKSPGCCRIDILVGRSDEFPYGLQGAVKGQSRHMLFQFAHCLARSFNELPGQVAYF